ncbi:MAG: pitrilysin family protein [Chitinivorax sp.]
MRLKPLCLAVCAALSLTLGMPPALADAPAATAVATSQQRGGELAKQAEVEGIREYRLPNGLRILLAPDASKPTTTVNITYLVGSRHENYGETGMAHLLEHLLFKGTPNNRNITQELSKRGMRPNGTTWVDRTNYFETFAANDSNLEWALQMEADRMVNSFIARKDLDTEMTVVRNEMERGENSPARILWEKVLASAYQWHNYGKSTIGARSDVENVKIENLQAFYHKYYQPDNAVLVVSGKFDEAKTLGLIQNHFGAIARPTRLLEPTYTVEPAQDGAREVVLTRIGDIQLLNALYHIPAGTHADFAPIAVLSEVLGSTPSGRLHKALVETKKAVGADADAYSMAEPGYITFNTELRKTDSATEARKIMLDVIENVSHKPISEQEVEIAKSSMLNDFEKVLNDPTRLGISLSEAISKGDWRTFFLYRDRIEAVKAADVNRVAQTYLLASNRTFGHFIPTDKPARVEVPQVASVTELVKDYKGKPALAAGEAFDPSPENIDARTFKAQLPNGMKLALLPKKNRGETVFISFNLHFGDEKSLFGNRSVSGFTAGMLMRGSKKYTREQLQIELDRLRTKLGVSGEGQVVTVGVETVRKNLPQVLTLMREILRQPAFPQQEFEQLRKQVLADLEASRTQPDAVAQRALARHFNVYPKGDIRYSGTVEEDAAAVNALTLAQLKRFYTGFYGANHAQMALVGDFDRAEAEALVQSLFGDWNSKAAYTRVPTPFHATAAARLKLETPDKANASFLAGLALPLRDSAPDYPALTVGNYILGGGFLNSRLAMRLRQKEGLSYGAGSFLSASSDEESGSFGAYAIYAPQNLDKLLAGFREELERALKDGFTEQEIAEAKTGILQSSQLRRAQDGSLAGTLAAYQRLGRDMKFVADFEAKLKALTPEQVLTAMRKYIDPTKLSLAYAGDFAKAEAKTDVAKPEGK